MSVALIQIKMWGNLFERITICNSLCFIWIVIAGKWFQVFVICVSNVRLTKNGLCCHSSHFRIWLHVPKKNVMVMFRIQTTCQLVLSLSFNIKSSSAILNAVYIIPKWYEKIDIYKKMTEILSSFVVGDVPVDGLTPSDRTHYGDVIMSSMASQITSLSIVYSPVYSGADQRKHQSSAALAFVRGIHRSTANSPHNGSVTRKMFPFDDVIMICGHSDDRHFKGKLALLS